MDKINYDKMLNKFNSCLDMLAGESDLVLQEIVELKSSFIDYYGEEE